MAGRISFRQELYNYLIEDFIIQYSQTLRKMDFRKNKKGNYAYFHPRIYLTEEQHTRYKSSLHSYFRQTVEMPRIMRGEKQELGTLINEEALLLARYIRNEKQSWNPRIASLTWCF